MVTRGKLLYAQLASYDVSDAEKMQAEKSIRWFDFCITKLKQADEHLNLIYNPFKKNPTIDSERVFEKRFFLRSYRDKVAENFNDFKKVAFKCYISLRPFMSDTQVEILISSFVAQIEDIEKQVNKLIELFSNLQAPDFGQAIVGAIENIKKEVKELIQIVDERIKSHIQENILARNWVDGVSQELQEKVEKKTPLVIELIENREKMMKGMQ